VVRKKNEEKLTNIQQIDKAEVASNHRQNIEGHNVLKMFWEVRCQVYTSSVRLDLKNS